MQGKIIKGVAGIYDVVVGENIYRCRAKGNFSKPERKASGRRLGGN